MVLLKMGRERRTYYLNQNVLGCGSFVNGKSQSLGPNLGIELEK